MHVLRHVPITGIDSNPTIILGRPKGGLAILFKRSLAGYMCKLETNSHRVCAAHMKRDGIDIYTIICLKSVNVRRLQVAILARSPREMSQTDRILPRYFLSRVRVSVRPRIFLYAKKLPNHSRPDH